MNNRLIARFDSKCDKHSIRITRTCISNWTPKGVSVRVENGSKTCAVYDQTVTDKKAVDKAWDEVVQPLIDKGFEFKRQQ